MRPIDKARIARERTRQPPTGLKIAARAEELHRAARAYLLKTEASP